MTSTILLVANNVYDIFLYSHYFFLLDPQWSIPYFVFCQTYNFVGIFYITLLFIRIVNFCQIHIFQ